MSTNVRLEKIIKKYGEFIAIDDIDFEIDNGEFFTLLGPSGCGKTTLLRMIAGFNSIEAGNIRFNDKIINQTPANKRDIGMVFQNYAIFPHLSVYENVEYGLKTRKIPKQERQKRIEQVLKIVQIENLKDRMPDKLSGGQQQRVALARAIVIEPKILLMDEPLSNLDAKLRVQMRTVIKKIQRKLNITTVYVTHDQEEALAISDRIAVMNKGKIMQIDTPTKIYQKPANSFVAGFIGISNFMTADVIDNNKIKIDDYELEVKLSENVEKVLVSVRPEQIKMSDNLNSGIIGNITMSTFLGDYIYYEVELENGEVIEVHEYTDNTLTIRDEGRVSLTFDSNNISLFSIDGEVRLNG
ncbi:MAG: ABC transporter ATP-binding protein [Erysipelotrichaceae bacterium]|nr:ABC transporter ATP-binding protein [Erysipelotrichaceae bacterium]